MIISEPTEITLKLMSNEIESLIEELGRVQQDIYEFMNYERLRKKLRDSISTKNEVNSQGTSLGNFPKEDTKEQSPDIHSQNKELLDKDYDKSLDIPYPRGHNWEGLTPRQIGNAYAKTNESVGGKE